MKTLAIPLCAVLALGSCHGPLPIQRHERSAETATNLKVLPLKHARAAEVAGALKAVLRQTRIVADERTNSLVVAYQSEAELAQIERCVAELDLEVPAAK
ncbi:MAG TPA: secretin N-terminal domain-containing protein [Planctomycetota bacterium]|nr:secretin N-terminal domain-containing protein [Planctomycetota bacterium]